MSQLLIYNPMLLKFSKISHFWLFDHIILPNQSQITTYHFHTGKSELIIKIHNYILPFIRCNFWCAHATHTTWRVWCGCWQPFLHYLVKSRLSRALLPSCTIMAYLHCWCQSICQNEGC